MSLFRIRKVSLPPPQKLLNVHFPTFLLSAFLTPKDNSLLPGKSMPVCGNNMLV